VTLLWSGPRRCGITVVPGTPSRVVTMVPVRAVMPVRGVVHVQTANPLGWRARNPSPAGPM